MNAEMKSKLMDKNERLIQMVIERAKRDFPDDIAIIGLTGSFRTGDFHEKSDLDLIIINNTDRGWEISYCFILDDVGYDLYCTPWDTRIQAQASLESPGVSSLTELEILYCAKPAYLEKFNAYRQQALDALAQPIGADCLNRARKWIDLAKQDYANTMLADDIGSVRNASAGVLYHLINALVSMNNTCIKRGIKRYLEQILQCEYVPEQMESLYMSVIHAQTVEDIRNASLQLLKSVSQLHGSMCERFITKPVPSYDNLRGTYEELWCNCRNKVLNSVEMNDKSYTFFAAMGAQSFLDEMTADKGTKKFDLMQYFEANDLQVFKARFLGMMDEYAAEYARVGRKVERFDTFEQLYAEYLKD
ncbi:nucleotidyltransferase domain-containing protein [Paenibacillus rhizovicinus]|uniref:Nucleotidyltransferase domain-containing protein n=1 Tax=Paenibacillus rhizovicinus TaxID=2704463 RepID=A0A6C0P651_9BACL|nr:nucleotidyltransferase domain-containing protein [Paenibacillus rhizovicinus]QHW34030.1 nucleotidyltransferase domain-containing protein [Paenibacillus rhizovicinus]